MFKKAFSSVLALCFCVGLISVSNVKTTHADDYTCCNNPKIVKSC